MDIIFQLSEYIVTFAESMIILSVITNISGKRFSGRKHLLLLYSFALVSTITVSLLNSISSFSYLTPLISMVLDIFVFSKVLTKGGCLIRSVSCLLATFTLFLMDYEMFLAFGLILNVPTSAFAVLMDTGVYRLIFILSNKLIECLVYFALRKLLIHVSKLSQQYQVFLLISSFLSYGVMQYLFSIYVSSDQMYVQSAIAISWVLMFVLVFIVIALLNMKTKAIKQSNEKELLLHANTMMAENYKKIQSVSDKTDKLIHDYNKHLTVIKGLADKENAVKTVNYIDDLFHSESNSKKICSSGNEIIDAIINCKAEEAEREKISFSFHAAFPNPSGINPIDICGLLSNQIDNAIEACVQIKDPERRIIIVEIKQVEQFAFFKVENTVSRDPFSYNPELKSTKSEKLFAHGLGLKNINDIAEKYNGTLRSEFKNGHFVSTAFLSFSDN